MSKSKLNSALERYYKSLGQERGITAYKRGGQMGFKKFWGGGNQNSWYGGKDIDSLKDKGLFNPSGEQTGTNWGGILGSATSIINSATSGFRDMSNNYRSLARSTSMANNGLFDGINDNSSLLSALGNRTLADNINGGDIRSNTIGQDIGSALSTGLNAGLSTGNFWIGLGATILDAGKSVAQRMQAQSYADMINRANEDNERIMNQKAYETSKMVDQSNDWMRMMAYYNNPFEYALGGEMRTHGSDFNNGFTFINEGGTHEQNPNEGVPSGLADDGTPNLVEEGEVIWNNEYVFSDRLKIPKRLANKYKLGGDLTFADAITKVTAESRERPNDPISNETNRAIVNEFMDEQEALREQEQLAAAENLQQAYDEDFMNQMAMMQEMQGMTPQQTPMDFQMAQPQMGGMPMEGAPMMGAYGGHKFEGGGDKWRRYYTVEVDENGHTYFRAPDGVIQYTENGARKHYELNKDLWRELPRSRRIAPRSSRPPKSKEKRTTENRAVEPVESRETLSNGVVVVYSKGYNGKRGSVHHYETSNGRNMGLNKERAFASQEKINREESNTTATPYTTVRRQSTITVPTAPQPSVNSVQTLPEYETVPIDTTRREPVVVEQETQQDKQPVVRKEYSVYGNPDIKEIRENGTRVGYRISGMDEIYTNYIDADRALFKQRVDTAKERRRSDSASGGKGSKESKPVATDNGNRGAFDFASSGIVQETLSPQVDTLSSRRTSQEGERKTTGSPTTVGSSSEKPVSTTTTTEKTAKTTGSTGTTGTARPTSTSSTKSSRPSSSSSSAGSTSTTSKKSAPAVSPTSTSSASNSSKQSLPKVSAKEVEKEHFYKSFVDMMEKSSDEGRKEYIDWMNQELEKSGSKRRIKSYADWKKNANDSIDGDIHNVTAKAANVDQRTGEMSNPISVRSNLDLPMYIEDMSSQGIKTRRAPTQVVGGNTQVNPDDVIVNHSKDYQDPWERLAPIYGSGIMAGNSIANGPNYQNADAIINAARAIGTPVNIPVQTIGDYLTYNPFDERYLVNMANQNRAAAARGIVNTAGGNRAMDLLGNMSLAYNNQIDLGEIMRQAYLANQQERKTVADFNRGTNVYNMNAINQRNLSQAQLNSQRQQAALSGLSRGYGMREDIWKDWRNDRDTNIDTFLDNLGLYGKEKMSDNMVLSLAREMGYNWTYNPKTGEYSFVKPETSAKGGNKKKRRF